MHEMSLVRSLMAQLTELVAQHGGGRLRQVRVQVGPLSGVEPALLASAWEHLQAAGGFAEATLEIENVPLVAHCRACDAEFRPARFCFRCPQCGGTQTDAISGDGIVLDSLVLDDAQRGATV